MDMDVVIFALPVLQLNRNDDITLLAAQYKAGLYE
jgi:hypothetical protein